MSKAEKGVRRNFADVVNKVPHDIADTHETQEGDDMGIRLVAICDRCFQREDLGSHVPDGGLPDNWGRVGFSQYHRGMAGNYRAHIWCPSCAGQLHNLFTLGYTVTKEAKDEGRATHAD